MSDPTEHLNAALEGRYRIERELGEGGMAGDGRYCVSTVGLDEERIKAYIQNQE